MRGSLEKIQICFFVGGCLQAARWRGGKRCAAPRRRIKSGSTLANVLASSVCAVICSNKIPVGDVEEPSAEAFIPAEDECEDADAVDEADEPADWEEEEEAPEWTKLECGVFTKEDELCVDLRRLQQRHGCSDATCDDILNTFSKYLNLNNEDLNFRDADNKLHKLSGAQVLRLDGCPKCNKHVYMPDDKVTSCPQCGHDRYNETGKPWEVWFDACVLDYLGLI